MHELRLQALSPPPGPTAHRRQATAAHLAGRFFGALLARAPDRAEQAWVAARLAPAEFELWRRMSRPDRRHALAVARTVAGGLPGGGADRGPLVAAALLHDVGKVTAGLGTWARVGATVIGGLGGRSRAEDWTRRGGPRARIGAYLRHPALGAELCRQAGSDPLVCAWAAEHHLPVARWSVPADVGALLKAADDD